MKDHNKFFDGFIRKKLDDHPPGSMEADWLKAEKLLDKRFPKKTLGKKGIYFFCLLALLAVTGLLLQFNLPPTTNGQIIAPKTHIKEDPQPPAKTERNDEPAGKITGLKITKPDEEANPEPDAIKKEKETEREEAKVVLPLQMLPAKVLNRQASNRTREEDKREQKVNDEQNENSPAGISVLASLPDLAAFLPEKESGQSETGKQENEKEELPAAKTEPRSLADTSLINPDSIASQQEFKDGPEAGNAKPVDSALLKKVSEKQDHASHLFILGGAALMQALENTAPAAGNFSTGILFGLGYRAALTGQWKFTLQALYLERGSLNSTKVYSVKDYDFGQRTKEVKITTNTLQYLLLPLSLEYTLHKIHHFQFGVHAAYLLQVQNEVFTYSKAEGSQVNETKQQTDGLRNGFYDIDYGLQAAYEYGFYKALRAGISLHAGLKDISNNAYYQNNSIDRNTGIRLYLSLPIVYFN